jgi:hypothetical protein
MSTPEYVERPLEAHMNASLFPRFPYRHVRRRFVRLDDSAWRRPFGHGAVPDQQDAVRLVDSEDADSRNM